MGDDTSKEQKQCFVVMGFGIKTDYATGRKLDLDKSYRLLIKPVVEGQGLHCLRADEMQYSGTIDVPMFQMLLQADVVVADLSTANVNAFYELGVRHALRPWTTIIISENKLPYPFDINHVKIESYTQLGHAIDYDEVERFRKVLGDTLQNVLENENTDSPVYTYLQGLIPPTLQQKVKEVAEQVKSAIVASGNEAKEVSSTDDEPEKKDPTLALIIAGAEQALKGKDYVKAKTLFNSALLLGSSSSPANMVGNNSYLLHRLALSTYKAKLPDEVTALKDAIDILEKLNLDHTNDSETVALAGSIEKKLYQCGQGDFHLSNAILYFQRGFYLLHNRYNGINLAFLLNCRVHSALDPSEEDRIADRVWANRTRRDVLDLCAKDWADINDQTDHVTNRNLPPSDDDFAYDQLSSLSEQRFWILVNKAEAHFGLGEMEEYEKAVSDAKAVDHEDWMMASFTNQVALLKEFLK